MERTGWQQKTPYVCFSVFLSGIVSGGFPSPCLSLHPNPPLVSPLQAVVILFACEIKGSGGWWERSFFCFTFSSILPSVFYCSVVAIFVYIFSDARALRMFFSMLFLMYSFLYHGFGSPPPHFFFFCVCVFTLRCESSTTVFSRPACPPAPFWFRT